MNIINLELSPWSLSCLSEKFPLHHDTYHERFLSKIITVFQWCLHCTAHSKFCIEWKQIKMLQERHQRYKITLKFLALSYNILEVIVLGCCCFFFPTPTNSPIIWHQPGVLQFQFWYWLTRVGIRLHRLRT